jgi:hypothetical protein
MKKILGLLLIVIGLSASAASPTFQSFNTNDFTADSTSNTIRVRTNGITAYVDAQVAGKLSSITTSNILYVAKSGNDATALRGRLDKQFLTITNALAQAVSNDVVYVGVGFFDIGTNTLTVPSGVHLKGSGWNTVISCSYADEQTALLKPTTNTIISDLHFIASATGVFQYAVGKGALDSPMGGTNYLINLRIDGDSDGIYISNNTNSTTIVDGCVIRTKFDCIIAQSGLRETLRVFNTRMESSSDSSIGTGVGIWNCGARFASGTSNTFSLQNCYIELQNTNDNRGVIFDGFIGNTLSLDGVVINNNSSARVVNEIYATGSGLSIGNVSRADGGSCVFGQRITPTSRRSGQARRSGKWLAGV